MTTQTAARKAEENDNSASKPKSPFIQETLQKLEILCDCLVILGIHMKRVHVFIFTISQML